MLKMPPARPYDPATADRVRVGLYIRQSHKNETDSLSSPLAQERSGRSYTDSQPGWDLVKIYRDIGISGYDPHAYRPGYEEMMSDVRAGELDVIEVFQLSRLTRKGARDALQIQGEMNDNGVGLVSTTEPFVNTTHDNPFSIAFFALIAALAEQESRNKSAFIRGALTELQERGSHTSGPVPYPFIAEPVHVDGVTIRRLKPNPAVEADALRLVELAEAGMTPGRIATTQTADKIPTPAAANDGLAAVAERRRTRRKGGPADDGTAEWSTAVVIRILRDPRLAGFAIERGGSQQHRRRTILRDANGEPVAPHIGLISPERWYKLQERLDGRTRELTPQRQGDLTLLGSWGMLRCELCTSGMTVSRAEGVYVCALQRAIGDIPRHAVKIPIAIADDIVSRRMWTRIGALDPAGDDADAALLAEAASRFAHQNASPELEAERLAVAAQLAHVRGTLETLYADRVEGLYAGETGKRVFREQLDRLTRHEDECAARLDTLDDAAGTAVRLPLDEWNGGADDPMGTGSPWSLWTVEERRGFLSIWADAVTVAPAPDRKGWTYGPTAGYERAMSRVTVTWASGTVPDET